MKFISFLMFSGLLLAETATIPAGAKVHVITSHESMPNERALAALASKKVPVVSVPLEQADYLLKFDYVPTTYESSYTVRTWKNCRSCSTDVSVKEHSGGPLKLNPAGCELIDLKTRRSVWAASEIPNSRNLPRFFDVNSEKKCAELLGRAVGKPFEAGNYVYDDESWVAKKYSKK